MLKESRSLRSAKKKKLRYWCLDRGQRLIVFNFYYTKLYFSKN